MRKRYRESLLICKVSPRYFFQNPRLVYIVPNYFWMAIKEFIMIVIVKWLLAALFAGFAWLVANYTAEYFRPYNRNK